MTLLAASPWELYSASLVGLLLVSSAVVYAGTLVLSPERKLEPVLRPPSARLPLSAFEKEAATHLDSQRTKGSPPPSRLIRQTQQRRSNVVLCGLPHCLSVLDFPSSVDPSPGPAAFPSSAHTAVAVLILFPTSSGPRTCAEHRGLNPPSDGSSWRASRGRLPNPLANVCCP